MKSLYESILDVDTKEITSNVKEIKKIQKEINRLIHKYFDQYSKEIKNNTKNQITDDHYLNHSEYKYALNVIGTTSMKFNKISTAIDEFFKEVKKIPKIKINFTKDSDGLDFMYAYAFIENYQKNDDFWNDECELPYPCIYFYVNIEKQTHSRTRTHARSDIHLRVTDIFME